MVIFGESMHEIDCLIQNPLLVFCIKFHITKLMYNQIIKKAVTNSDGPKK